MFFYFTAYLLPFVSEFICSCGFFTLWYSYLFKLESKLLYYLITEASVNTIYAVLIASP